VKATSSRRITSLSFFSFKTHMGLSSGTSTFSLPRVFGRFDADTWGVGLSIFCAIHCVATPFLLLLVPAFGTVWAHPASHAVVAVLVVPLAFLGFLRAEGPNRKWILACGATGLILILWGALVPFAGFESEGAASTPASMVDDNTEFVFHVGDESEAGSDLATCSPECCPAFLMGEDGTKALRIPLASILTTMGGIALIAAHAGNLLCCSRRGRNCLSSKKAPLLLPQ